MAGLSPMMTQYVETKKQYPDCILFYRLGDFYEMFFEDALTASKELEITLTGKECGLEERAPMCGVPYHAVDSYLYTITSSQALDETKNNYLMGIVYIGDTYGISTCDMTTGDYLVTEVEGERNLLDEIHKFAPSEIICNEAFYMSSIDLDDLKNRYHVAVSSLDSHYFSDDSCRKVLKEHFHVSTLDGLGLADYDAGVIAAGAVMEYLYETQKNSLAHIVTITPYTTGQFMIIDTSTRRNLELLETMREKQKRGTLLWVLDKTKTAMGARTLRKYIEQPLIDKSAIEKRLDAVCAAAASSPVVDYFLLSAHGRHYAGVSQLPL